MGKEYRCFGPPGTGKTTWLSRAIEQAVDKYGSDQVLVASFTRTAAAELVSRKISVAPGSVGTLHSICFHALGRPEIAELNIDIFNEEHPEFLLSDQKMSTDESLVEQVYKTEADTLFSQYKIAKARLQNLAHLPKRTIEFIRTWDRWKSEHDFMDFGDMILFMAQDNGGPPGGQNIGFYDEAQDFNALELMLVRKWAEHQDQIIIAGDDDQSLFDFTGARPEAFLFPVVPDEQKRILTQSYRIPRAVHMHATSWIQHVKVREPKEYKPRDEEGSVEYFHNGDYSAPEYILEKAIRDSETGTVMILTTCGYMLNQTKMFFRQEGIPFHNPYRRTRGDWNPLRISTDKAIAIQDRILSFLDGTVTPGTEFWTSHELARWLPIISSKGVLKKGAKQIVSKWDETPPSFTKENVREEYMQLFEGEGLEAALKRDLRWFAKHVVGARQNAINYPIKIIERYGMLKLKEVPKIIISTVHGVKGGEADSVYLFPDISPRAMDDAQTKSFDQLIRVFYVGMTRARKKLTILDPASDLSMRI